MSAQSAERVHPLKEILVSGSARFHRIPELILMPVQSDPLLNIFLCVAIRRIWQTPRKGQHQEGSENKEDDRRQNPFSLHTGEGATRPDRSTGFFARRNRRNAGIFSSAHPAESLPFEESGGPPHAPVH